jgi:uncharacterized protein YukE
MATLHMDVEIVRSANSVLRQSSEELISLIVNISESNTGLQSAWIGNSANEYSNRIQTWLINAQRLNEQLNELNAQLVKEVNQWEEMAARMG